MTKALCGICGKPVPYAYYDDAGQLQAEEGHTICSDSNTAYHFERGQDCWGEKTGYPSFLTEQERMRLWEVRLNDGHCPSCNSKLIRGRTIIRKIVNRWNLRKICPKCGFTHAGQ